MKIIVPEFSLIALIGVTGSGKSSFGRRHFLPTEVVSSDFCRGLVADDENAQGASGDAFDILYTIVGKRLKNYKLTVIDATSVQAEDRKRVVEIAREYHTFPVAIVLDMPESVCRDRNAQRSDRQFGPHVITRQRSMLKRSLRNLEREGFRRVYVLNSEEDVNRVELIRERMWTDKTDETGPFDIIGDVHGCFDELIALLTQLGYAIEGMTVTPPAGRKAVFVGDLVDRGPKIPQVMKLVMGMVEAGTAICVPGNHDMKLLRALRGKNVQVTHGLADSLTQLAAETGEFRQEVIKFLNSLVSHYVLDGGKLVVAHAGMKESMMGRAAGAVRDFALYGETTGESDEFGLPVRLNWAADYRGRAMVVYGHTPVPQPEWLNNTMNIDTGCVFGGALTALRYPEQELVSVPALQTYVEPIRPFLVETIPPFSAQQEHDDVLDIADVVGKRLIDTRLQPKITIREANATAALEVMSRYAVNPKWLVYLPPTMSPVETSDLPDLLEHPSEAFDYYRRLGVEKVVCEEKHMGSRAVVVVCKDESVAQKRFGVTGEGIGTVYTRTGRRFFTDPATESAFLVRVRDAISTSGLWEALNSDWLVLDCELMPWSAKAHQLINLQYAPVGTAGIASMALMNGALAKAVARGAEADGLLERFTARAERVEAYREAYRRYCWEVQTLDDLTLAPFHLLASEGEVHTAKDHIWHMTTLARLAEADPALLMATPFKVVEVHQEASIAEGVAWWEAMTATGGEGMVKPYTFITTTTKGLIQPAVKVRGREYLRIIYGPEYTAPDQLPVLRKRGLGAKRSLALREFALGVEALERFVRREPLRRVHECVFGVLALESEPVDPRL